MSFINLYTYQFNRIDMIYFENTQVGVSLKIYHLPQSCIIRKTYYHNLTTKLFPVCYQT